MKYDIRLTGISGLYEIICKKYEDGRGFFSETFDAEFFKREFGFVPVQENASVSKRGVIRGLHYQEPQQAKLITVPYGEILDVAVDLRRGSATYGKWKSFHMVAGECRHILIPRGMAHGFSVLSETARVEYKVDRPYAPDYQMTMPYDQLPIDWGLLGSEVILSDKDKNAKPIAI